MCCECVYFRQPEHRRAFCQWTGEKLTRAAMGTLLPYCRGFTPAKEKEDGHVKAA